MKAVRPGDFPGVSRLMNQGNADQDHQPHKDKRSAPEGVPANLLTLCVSQVHQVTINPQTQFQLLSGLEVWDRGEKDLPGKFGQEARVH